MDKIRVTIWNEFIHEHTDEAVRKVYPEGIHAALREQLADERFEIRTAYLEQDAEHGLSREVLDNTDVLVWWGHLKHDAVRDDVAQRVVERVHEGMGFIALHSAHMCKPFVRLMGTPCKLRWRENDEKARIFTVAPTHPITQGVPMHFELPAEETYAEYFQIPTPDELIFITWYMGGDVFRGGCTFHRGAGKIFYFHPGHETYGTFYNEHIIRVLKNAIVWAKPAEYKDFEGNANVKPFEAV